MIVRNIDLMFKLWSEELFSECDDDHSVFSKYKDRMYESIEQLLKDERKLQFCNMLKYYYQGRLADIL